MIEANGITPKGLSMTDRLWAMARDGATLLEIGEQTLKEFEAIDPGVASDAREDDPTGMEYAAILLASSLGILMIEPPVGL